MANKTISITNNNNDDFLFDKKLLTNAFNGNIQTLNNVDLDTVTELGIFYVHNGTNFPSGGNGILIVMQGSAAVIRQIYFRQGTIDSNDMYWYTRQVGLNGSSIGTWVKIANYNDCFYKTGDSFSYYVKSSVAIASGTIFRFQIPLAKPVASEATPNVTLGIVKIYQDKVIDLTNNISSVTVAKQANCLEVTIVLNSSGLFTKDLATVCDINCTVSFT